MMIDWIMMDWIDWLVGLNEVLQFVVGLMMIEGKKEEMRRDEKNHLINDLLES